MIKIGTLKNKYIISLFSFILISVIGLIDYITGPEISFFIFYLIPIIFITIYKGSTKPTIIANTLFASIVWFIADYYTKEYTNSFAPYWNAFVRFAIYVIVGLLVFNLKEKYQKLVQINAELKRLNQEKNKFIGIAAHDLRNPIGGIYSFSDLLLSNFSEKLDQKVKEIIEHIKVLSKNTLDLIKNLLDISMIESGIIEISPINQDYIVFINKQIYLNELLAGKKNIKITLESTENELFFEFDDQYLSEVINNLLTNAIKFSYTNSEIIVKIYITEKNTVKTEIIDKGKGIPTEEQNKLFNYFQKTSTLPTGGETSTGLGLAIAKKIIAVHKGFIGVISELDKGSNFYFELPLNK